MPYMDKIPHFTLIFIVKFMSLRVTEQNEPCSVNTSHKPYTTALVMEIIFKEAKANMNEIFVINVFFAKLKHEFEKTALPKSGAVSFIKILKLPLYEIFILFLRCL